VFVDHDKQTHEGQHSFLWAQTDKSLPSTLRSQNVKFYAGDRMHADDPKVCTHEVGVRHSGLSAPSDLVCLYASFAKLHSIAEKRGRWSFLGR
jgi:hypothetical protein